MIDNRDDWLKARLNGIGASEASCIIGANPWKSNVDLWKEKTRRIVAEDIGYKDCVKYGKLGEEYVRGIFALDYPNYKIEYDEFGMIANRLNEPWLFATLDGHIIADNDKNGVLEIKTTEIQQSSQWEHWANQVPQYYYCQILHQLLATGYEFAILRADIRYHKGEELRHTVRDYIFERKDCTEDMEFLLKKEKEFWNFVQADKEPPLQLPDI